jgi:polysaccharide export outer membrane protein
VQPATPESNASAAPISTAGLIPAEVGLPPNVARTETYRIGPDDVLRIEVFQVEDLSTTERVNESGAIVMPLIGAVQVGGLTPSEAEARIATALGKDYLQDPQVNLFVETYANLSFTVGGAVNKPGVFPLTGQTTLLEAVAQAGGATRVANRSELILFRQQPGGTTRAYVINLKRVQAGELGDPVLVSNDKVMVPESGTAIFVQGVSDTLRGFVSPFGL